MVVISRIFAQQQLHGYLYANTFCSCGHMPFKNHVQTPTYNHVRFIFGHNHYCQKIISKKNLNFSYFIFIYLLAKTNFARHNLFNTCIKYIT